MASRLIQFPVRNAFAPIRSHDSLARDTDHAGRIDQQVEQEMARKAQRMSVGLRIEFAEARPTSLPTNLLVMPAGRSIRGKGLVLIDKTLAAASFAMNRLLLHPFTR